MENLLNAKIDYQMTKTSFGVWRRYLWAIGQFAAGRFSFGQFSAGIWSYGQYYVGQNQLDLLRR